MRHALTLFALPVFLVGSFAAAEPAPDELVRQLGDPSFAVRQRASASLRDLGPTAGPALSAGQADANPEIRLRCARVLRDLSVSPLERRVDRFLADIDRESAPLPGWQRFRERFGDRPSSRELFGVMTLAEPDLLADLEREPATAAARLPEMMHAVTRFDAVGDSAGRVFAMLFVTGETDARLGVAGGSLPGLLIRSAAGDLLRNNDSARDVLVSYLDRPGCDPHACKQAISTARNLGLLPFTDRLREPARRCIVRVCDRPSVSPVLLADTLTLCRMADSKDLIDSHLSPTARRVFADWQPSVAALAEASEALSLARTLHVREARGAALRIARDPAYTSFVRGQAVSLLGRIGDPERSADIEPLLKDTTPLGSASIGTVSVRAELRDVALATLVELAGQAPGEFGFPYPKAAGPVFHELPPNCFGFTDDAERQTVTRKWRELRGR